MHAWLRALTELERDGEASVLVTVVTARGSTPREAGCKMVVTRNTRFDTIGGGNLEFTCIETARRMLHAATGLWYCATFPSALNWVSAAAATYRCCSSHCVPPNHMSRYLAPVTSASHWSRY